MSTIEPGTLRVLLVEDSPDDTRLVQAVLAKAREPRFELVHVRQLSEALARVTEGRIDVVLLDLNLPDSDGVGTFTRMSAAAPAVPIVVLTASDDTSLITQLLELGVQNYLKKQELCPGVLIGVLRCSVRQNRALTEVRAEYDQLNELLTAIHSGQVDSVMGNDATAKILHIEALEVHEENKRLTRELSEFNADLQVELAERKRAGAELRRAREANAPKANILLVDDAPDGLLALEAALTSLGHNLVKAGSGTEALKWLLENECAVILLDMRMPVMDGFETAALIRERDSSRGTPIIFVSGATMDDMHEKQAYSVGAVDYLFKPLVPEIVRAKVEVFVGLWKITREREQEKEREKEREVQELRHDIAQRKRAEAAAQELMQMKSDLIANVSHELRTPICSMKGFLDLLLKGKVKDPAVQQEFLIRAASDANRLTALVSDLLDVSRMEAGRLELELGDVDVSALIVETLQSLEGLAQDKEICLIPATSETPLAVRGDRRRLRQVLTNLVGNGIKFSEARHSIRVTGTMEGGSCVVRVIDEGPGIPAAELPKLFSRFYQSDSAQKRRGQGTGLGLYISQQIIQAHGGRIGAESEVGRGSTFFFVLPAHSDEHVPCPHEEASALGPN
ncbi:MAG: response regulator [candidate division NC10 bacterium]